MAEPVFGAEDRVSTTDLPAELRNETDPKKIAAYYQRREASLRDELRRNTTPLQNTRVQIERPTDDASRQPALMSVEEAEAARQTLTVAARQAARIGKKYWDRLSADIERLMDSQPPENRVSSQIWETCYNTLLGMNMDRLVREDAEAASTAARVATERSSAQPEAAATPSPLPAEVTSKILPGLGLTEDQYRTAESNISSGKWPLTAENLGGRRIPVGGGR